MSVLKHTREITQSTTSAEPAKRVSRKAVTALAVAALAFVSIGIASPAQAAPAPATTVSAVQPLAAGTPYFTIFFSPGCTGASRTYAGYNTGESWINDTFTQTSNGSAGLNQLIRNNAASIVVYNARTGVSTDNGYSYRAFFPGGCRNFVDGLRNHNTGWYTQAQ